MTTLLPHWSKGLHLLAARLINHETALAPPHAMMPVCPTFVTNVVFVKIAVLNGLIAPCTILPLDRKPQRTLMPCANLLTPQNLNHPPDITPCHHVASANTTCCITPTTVVVPGISDCLAACIAPCVAACAVALHVIHPVVITHMTIVPVVNPCDLAMIITLGTMTLPQAPLLFSTIKAPNDTVVLTAPLCQKVFVRTHLIVSMTSQHPPTPPLITPTIQNQMLIILPGALTQIRIHFTLFISMGMVIV